MQAHQQNQQTCVHVTKMPQDWPVALTEALLFIQRCNCLTGSIRCVLNKADQDCSHDFVCQVYLGGMPEVNKVLTEADKGLGVFGKQHIILLRGIVYTPHFALLL